MSCLVMVLCLIFSVGCSRAPDADVVVSESNPEDGGTVENADRDKAQEYFRALAKVQSAEEEEKLLNGVRPMAEEEGIQAQGRGIEWEAPSFLPVFPSRYSLD